MVERLVACRENFMIVCEYCFKDFHARGSDAYLTAWATKADQMAVEGWEVVEYVPSVGYELMEDFMTGFVVDNGP
jgi:hypothetical protein